MTYVSLNSYSKLDLLLPYSCLLSSVDRRHFKKEIANFVLWFYFCAFPVNGDNFVERFLFKRQTEALNNKLV